MKINYTFRSTLGTSSSRSIRLLNKIPCIIFGNNKPLKNIVVEERFINKFLKNNKLNYTIYLINNNDIENVILRDIQYHGYKSLILHISFERINELKKMIFNVPLNFVNKKNNLIINNINCNINYIKNKISIICFPKYLPEYINVDLNNLKEHKNIKLFDIKLPKNVYFLNKKNILVVNIKFPKK